jgi:hypothetical protein
MWSIQRSKSQLKERQSQSQQQRPTTQPGSTLAALKNGWEAKAQCND